MKLLLFILLHIGLLFLPNPAHYANLNASVAHFPATFSPTTSIEKHASPRPKLIKRLTERKNWHWASFVALLFIGLCIGFAYLLFASPASILYWVIVACSPFISFIFAWVAFNAHEDIAENYLENRINWYIILSVTCIIYILMGIATILTPLMFVLSAMSGVLYAGGDILSIWRMWENPPRVPPYPKKP